MAATATTTTTKKTILITGANGGLGSAIIEQIASKPEYAANHGLYTVRDPTNAPALTSALSHGPTHSHDILKLDLSKLDNVREAAQEINSRVAAGTIPPIGLLILNAGFQDFGKQSWTDDDALDTAFAANYLSHWLLTLLLLQSIDKESGRIVVIGSFAHDPNDPHNASTGAFQDPRYKTIVSDAAGFEDIAKGRWSSASEDASFRSGYRRYGAAKLFLIMMQHELQARLSADPVLGGGGVRVLGVDPGPMITGIQRLAPWVIRVLIFKIVYPLVLRLRPINSMVRAPSRSAADVLKAAFGEAVEEEPQDAYFDEGVRKTTSEESRDPEKRKLVWKETARLAGLKEGDTVLADWQ
ncbi:putative short-chain dehydrogenase [Xylaria palmicola]|nr:putative short-chain dehydrogenase [Xylaria palmicola]